MARNAPDLTLSAQTPLAAGATLPQLMGKTLVIAEKPSVANDIARAIGGFKKHEDYFESDQFVLSSAVGHLLELCVDDQHSVAAYLRRCITSCADEHVDISLHRQNLDLDIV